MLCNNNLWQEWNVFTVIQWIYTTYLALSVTGVMDRVRIQTLKLVWREEDASLMTFYLCKKVLLLIIMRRCHITWENIRKKIRWPTKGSHLWYQTGRQKDKEILTLHADKQQVRCQRSPVSLSLLLVDPVPVKTKKVNNNLLPYSVIQCLLQIDSWNGGEKRRALNESCR